MKNLNFFIVDVFAEEKLTGNQLAVVRGSEVLSKTEMQRIAKEMHFSETTFILTDEPHHGGYDVRIFSPKKEMPFAGHPTLGTAYVIQQHIIKKPVPTIALNLLVGQIPITFQYNKGLPTILWMKQLPPTFGPTFKPAALSQILKLDPEEIDPSFPIQSVSTGLPFIIVPLKTLAGLEAARISQAKYEEFITNSPAKALLIFCPETSHGNDLSVRVFAEYYGVPEDPATGSANGCLAGYLVKYRYFRKAEIEIRVEQGHMIGRPSLLYLTAKEKDHRIEVTIGGKVVEVATGTFS